MKHYPGRNADSLWAVSRSGNEPSVPGGLRITGREPARRQAANLPRANRLALICGGIAWLSLAAIHAQSLANHFGFTGPEIFPIDQGISSLRAADLDGDGSTDLLVVNNLRSKISVLYNQTGRTQSPTITRPAFKREINELPPDARFRIESIASEKRISALVVADLNGDQRPDLAYYGEPKELVAHFNQGSNSWSAPKRWAIEDGDLSPNGLTAGDLNGDGLTDLVLLSEKHVYLLAQTREHTLAEPVRIPIASPVKSVQVLDVDGDQRCDLLLVNWESQTPFRFRLQDPTGQLGPEMYFTMPSVRSYTADNLEANARVQIVTIAQSSGRAAIAEFARKPAEPLAGFRQGQFQVLPLTKTEKARRGLLWADLDGDQRADLIVAEPESGRLSVHFQKPDGTLAEAKSFPTLMGVTELASADWDGDGRAELFLLSGDEKSVGVTRLDEHLRVPFPSLIPLEGKPLALAVGGLQAGAKPTLALIVDQDGRRRLLTRAADGTTRSQTLGENFRSNPTTLIFHDANQDGLADLVLLTPYEKIKVLLQVPGQDFDEQDIAPPGGGLENPWLSVADVDGDAKPELLLAQKHFLRAVVLQTEPAPPGSTNKPAWTFRVKEQINGVGGDSRLVGAAAIPSGTNATPALFLLDAERKTLTLCERDASGVWQIARNVPLPVTDFTSLRPVALGGPTANCVGFFGLNAVAWLALSGDTWELRTMDNYETPIRDGYLRDVISGDLNHDGRKDLVFLETAKNYVDLVLFDANHKLVPGNRWQVFEQRMFRGRPSDQPEPREAAVADLTGDGKNDLVVLVHDRLLLYPQE
ncbi:MAG TPA: VCBS repeat-containing protein [Verrucomicrobiae bacterium]